MAKRTFTIILDDDTQIKNLDFSTAKAQFDSWFEDVKGTLDSDAAGITSNRRRIR